MPVPQFSTQLGSSTELSTQLIENRPPIVVDRNGGSFSLSAGLPRGSHPNQWERSGARPIPQQIHGPMIRSTSPSLLPCLSPEELNTKQRIGWHLQNVDFPRTNGPHGAVSAVPTKQLVVWSLSPRVWRTWWINSTSEASLQV